MVKQHMVNSDGMVTAWCASRHDFNGAFQFNSPGEADDFGRAETWAVVVIASGTADEYGDKPPHDPTAIYWKGKKYIPAE